MFCNSCGANIQDDARFCIQCGTSASGRSAPAGAPQPGSSPAPSAPPSPPPPPPTELKGFFASLFDFSFSSMITVKIVQILYALSLIGVGLYVLLIIGIAFSADSAVGVVVLIISPVIFIFFAIFARVYLEMIIVLFKIADNTAETAANTRSGTR